MAFYADTLSWFRANKSLFLLLNGICLAEVQQIFSFLPDRVSNDTEYVLCRNHSSVISSYMTSHWVCNKSYTTGAISETGTVYPSGEPEFIPLAMSFCRIRVGQSLVFNIAFCISLFVLLSVGLCIVCPSSIYGFWLPLCYLQHFPRAILHKDNFIKLGWRINALLAQKKKTPFLAHWGYLFMP